MPDASAIDGSGEGGNKFKVIIIGAGLGGCATAMAMHYQGFDVVMYEKVREFQRLGDSLGLGVNALKLLKRWGGRDQFISDGRCG
jgi:2-polyprenyl-6-methoxyphenol hydroxylase-like FAD-dependent oxidoreductase